MRRNRRPIPGHPLANVEKSLCKRPPLLCLKHPATSLRHAARPAKPLNGGCVSHTFGGSKVDNSALQSDCDGVGAVVSAELGKDVGDVTLDRRFPDGKLVSNLFVGIS